MNKKIIAGISGGVLAVAAVAGYLLSTYQLPPHVPAVGRLASGNIMLLETSGNENEYKLYDLRGTNYKGVYDCASYAIIMADVVDSVGHGIRIGQASKSGCKPHHVIVINSTVKHSVLQNNPPLESNNWSSCIKVELGASYVEIRNNTVENCYGEGIDVSESSWVNVIGNTLLNCWSYCIYIDNSTDVVVYDNKISCLDPAFNRNGKPATAAGVGDENLSQWGGNGIPIAARITITENTSYKCQAPKYWGGDFPNGGVDTLAITNNTIYDTSTRVSVANKPRNANINTIGNVYLGSGSTVLPATETKTQKPATPTGSPSKTPTVTKAATFTATAIPSATVTPPACITIFDDGLYIFQACKK